MKRQTAFSGFGVFRDDQRLRLGNASREATSPTSSSCRSATEISPVGLEFGLRGRAVSRVSLPGEMRVAERHRLRMTGHAREHGHIDLARPGMFEHFGALVSGGAGGQDVIHQQNRRSAQRRPAADTECPA